MATNSQESGPAGTLRDDYVQSVSVQEHQGSLQVTIPIEAARDLDITDGSVLFCGEAGDDVLKLGKPSRVLSD